MERFGKAFTVLFAAGLICAALMVTPAKADVEPCVGPLEKDDTLGNTRCCSGVAIPGSTECENPEDYGTTWASCTHTCAPQA